MRINGRLENLQFVKILSTEFYTLVNGEEKP
jgi:hypothetical protein